MSTPMFITRFQRATLHSLGWLDVTAPDGTPLSPATATKQIANAKNAHAQDQRAATEKAKAR